MLRFGLIGRQIEYSKSPAIHNFLKGYLKKDFSYDLIDIDPSSLKILIEQLKLGIYHGFNVTQPYKEDIMEYVDIVAPRAKKIQAVNTIYMKDGLIVGDNTDYEGFLGLLLYHHIEVEHKDVYILGTGGAAKACYQVLNDLKASVKYVTRDSLKANDQTITYQELYDMNADLLIQATPVGTYPYTDQSVLKKAYVKDKFVVDLVYRPQITQILKDAKDGVSGVLMLIIQAVKSLSLWLDEQIEIKDELIDQLKDVVIDE